MKKLAQIKPEYGAALRLGYIASTNILDRLDGVRDAGNGTHMAKCPAHDDSSPSLKVTFRDDRTLIHCFAGCSVESVLESLGLTFSDLFPESVKPQTRQLRRPARQALQTLDREALVVLIIASDMLAHKIISEDVLERLTTAVGRIGKVRDEVAPAGYRA
jgi:hypothetical protein